MIIVATSSALVSPLVLEDVRVAQRRRIPRLALVSEKAAGSERRLQLSADLQIADIEKLVDYLAKLKSQRGGYLEYADPGIMFALGAPRSPSLKELEREEAKRKKLERQEYRREQALETQRGKLVHKINDRMQIGRREFVEVRLGSSETSSLSVGLMGTGSLTEELLPIVETMTIDLVSPNEAFEVTPQTRKTQLVTGELLLWCYARCSVFWTMAMGRSAKEAREA